MAARYDDRHVAWGNMEDDWEHQLRADGRVRIGQSRTKLLFALAGCVAFTAASSWLLLAGETFVGIAGLAFFGVLGIPAIGVQLARHTELVVTPTGIELSRLPRLPWTEIATVGRFQVKATPMVVLGLTDDGHERIRRNMNRHLQLLYDANDAYLGGPSLTLPTTLSARTDELGSWLAQVHHRAVDG